MKWELAEEQPSAMGDGFEVTPVEYPRSDINRGQVSYSNKGAASRNDIVLDAVASNTTGNTNVPRRAASVNYEAGTYPEGVMVNEDMGGIDEGDGASR